MASGKPEDLRTTMFGQQMDLTQEIVLTPEQVKPLKAMMMEKGFFVKDLKKTLKTADEEVYMSRVGNSCSDAFVKLMTSNEC